MAIVEALSGATTPDVEILGIGTDHVAFLVDGRWVLREPLEPSAAAAAALAREQQLLLLLDGICPVPVPRPVAVDAGEGLIVLERLAGTPLLDVDEPDVEGLVEPLAAVLRALSLVPASAIEGLVEPDVEPLATFVEEAAELVADVAVALDPGQREVLDRFLRMPLPPEPDPSGFVLCHNDLGAEHVLVAEDGRVTGLIDWSDAAWTDPARDLGRIARDLGPAAAERIGSDAFGSLGPLRPRVQLHACCSLVEDLAHGLTGGPRRYADAALAAFDRTFAYAIDGRV